MYLSRLIILLLVGLVVSVGCEAKEELTDQVDQQEINSIEECPTDVDFHFPQIQKFAVSLQGEDVGYMEIRIEELPGDSLLVTQETSWDLILMGNRRHVAMTLEARTDSNLDMASMDLWMTDGSSEILTSSVRNGNELHTVITTADRDIEMNSRFEGDYLPVLADLAAACMDWEVGQDRVFPTFDPATGMVFEATVTCIGFETMPLLADSVLTTKLSISQVGLNNTAWVWEGQIVREEEAGLGMVMVRVLPEEMLDMTFVLNPALSLYHTVWIILRETAPVRPHHRLSPSRTISVLQTGSSWEIP